MSPAIVAWIFAKLGLSVTKLLEWLLGKRVTSQIKWSRRSKVAFSLLLIIATYGATDGLRLAYNLTWGGVDRTKFGFENQSEVWTTPQAQDMKRGFALSSAGVTTAYSIKGKSSMLVRVDLDGTEKGRAANKHQGEVFVDMRFVRPRSLANDLVVTSVDLSNKVITGGIYIPPTLVGQDHNHAIFIQVFLETCDASKRRFTLEPPWIVTQAGLLGFRNKTNNAMNEVCRIGIKMGLNDEDHNEYHGEIYIDAIDW